MKVPLRAVMQHLRMPAVERHISKAYCAGKGRQIVCG